MLASSPPATPLLPPPSLLRPLLPPAPVSELAPARPPTNAAAIPLTFLRLDHVPDYERQRIGVRSITFRRQDRRISAAGASHIISAPLPRLDYVHIRTDWWRSRSLFVAYE